MSTRSNSPFGRLVTSRLPQCLPGSTARALFGLQVLWTVPSKSQQSDCMLGVCGSSAGWQLGTWQVRLGTWEWLGCEPTATPGARTTLSPHPDDLSLLRTSDSTTTSTRPESRGSALALSHYSPVAHVRPLFFSSSQSIDGTSLQS